MGAGDAHPPSTCDHPEASVAEEIPLYHQRDADAREGPPLLIAINERAIKSDEKADEKEWKSQEKAFESDDKSLESKEWQ